MISKYGILAIWTVLVSLLTSSLTAHFLSNSKLEFRDEKGNLRIRIGAYEDAGSIVLFADDGTRIMLQGRDRSRIAILSKHSSPVVLITSMENGSFVGFQTDTSGGKEPSGQLLYEGINWPKEFPVTLGISPDGQRVDFRDQ